ncbi:MAG: hypothetical protein QW076_00795, partial [Candidatus Anstonellales archaeon]
MNKIAKLLPITITAMSLNSLYAQKPLVEQQNNPPIMKRIPSLLLSRESLFLYNLLNEVKKTRNPEHLKTIIQQVQSYKEVHYHPFLIKKALPKQVKKGTLTLKRRRKK